MTPLDARRVLDLYFLEARCKILDLAAILDRLARAPGVEQLATDPRLLQLRRALEVLAADRPDKAEHIQMIFSLDYDPDWPRPQPRL